MPPFAALPRRLLTGLVTLSLVASFGATAAPALAADGGELFFSEYVEGSSFNKAVEIYNPNDNAVDLGGYAVQVYSNGATTAGQTAPISGATIAGHGVYVLAHESADPAILAVADQTTGLGLWNGDDAVTLVHNGTAVDVIGQIGSDPGSQWGSGDVSTADNTLRRKATVLTGDPNGSDAFDPSVQWEGYPNGTFGGLGSHSTTSGGNQVVSIVCGASVQVLEGAGENATITATDPDGIVTDISIASVTPDDPGISITSVTPATENGGEASATLTVADTTAAGSYSVEVTATNADETAQTASCTLSVGVNAIQTIGAVQGQVADDGNPTTQTSAFDGDTVVVRGVVTEPTLARTNSGGSSWSFYIQNSLATDDNDPLTSDGIQIFNNRFATIRFSADPRGPQYTPVVGDEIVVSGKVDEYFNMTELASPFIERVVRHGVDLSTELASVQANPSHDLHEALVFWERHESMVVSIPAGARVTAGRDVFASTADGEMWVIRGDDALAQRADPYARRVFRDFHPLDDVPGQVFDNQNGERMLLTSHGLKAAANDDSVLIAPARTLYTVTNQLSGVVNYSFGKYGIEVAQQPQLQAGADPALNAPPQPTVAGEEYATSDYNVENLYDFRDDPNDGCDFLGNAGCPGVKPPFDYVPLSQADYDQHLSDLAAQIAGPMHAPDILMIQEAEDQDICSVVAGTMSCGSTDNADGQPDTLQDLALAVASIGGPTYLTAYDRDGADDRGIISAFMYRTDSVELLPVSADDPVLGATPTVDYRSDALAYNTNVSNPKALNAVLPDDVNGDTDGDNVYTRAPQVGHFRVWRDGIGQSVFTDLYAISNHFSSGPDGRVEQRTEQAAYNAAIVAALQAANPDERVVSAGDFNVFPRPDDPFPNDPSDQLGPLYEAGLHNLFDVLVDEVPSSAYSYVFEGQAQTLDQLFATSSLFDELVQIRAAHINADYAADYDGDVARGASDHDPQVARWSTDVTFARLVDLVDYYVATGQVDASKAGKLYDRLDRAAAFLARGKTDAYRSQLRALGDQAQDLAPHWISSAAAHGLEKEADRLAAM